MAVSLGVAVTLWLACWRLTSLFYSERGPWDIFVKIRTRFGIIHDGGEPTWYPETGIGKLFACFWCLSMWVAFVLAVLYGWCAGLPVWQWPFIWLASSAGAILIEQGMSYTE